MKCFVIPVTTGASEIVTKGEKAPANNTRQVIKRLCKIQLN